MIQAELINTFFISDNTALMIDICLRQPPRSTAGAPPPNGAPVCWLGSERTTDNPPAVGNIYRNRQTSHRPHLQEDTGVFRSHQTPPLTRLAEENLPMPPTPLFLPKCMLAPVAPPQQMVIRPGDIACRTKKRETGVAVILL
jgi:hypothetical protein